MKMTKIAKLFGIKPPLSLSDIPTNVLRDVLSKWNTVTVESQYRYWTQCALCRYMDAGCERCPLSHGTVWCNKHGSSSLLHMSYHRDLTSWKCAVEAFTEMLRLHLSHREDVV